MPQFITRKFSFDAAHRVVGHVFNNNDIDEHGINHGKCKNMHGHRYDVELSFKFSTTEKVGYAIDFAEIKRLAKSWVDDYWDHGAVMNPADTAFNDLIEMQKMKLWKMTLGGPDFCNPSAENMSKELFMICEDLFQNVAGLTVFSVKLFETANCFVETFPASLTETDRANYRTGVGSSVLEYAARKGVVNYSEL
jgi:6-pyruvoyltetrahydropterin/6-carboxytetrahydropterin synthase